MYNVKMIHFEPTQMCQASCPMCDRNKNGGEVNQYLKDESMTLEGFQKAFSPEFLAQLETFYFCGNHGDPIFAPDMLEIAEYVRHSNPSIHMFVTTNGGARKPDWWEKLAGIVNFVNFSVDGLQDTNHFYRQGVKWEHVEENMAAFCDAGGYAKWTFLVFNYNEHQVKQAEMFSQILGVKEFIVKKSGRYINTADLRKKDDHQAIFRGQDAKRLAPPQAPKYRNKAIDEDYNNIIKQFGSMDKFIDVAEIQPKCVAKKEIYVSAEGLVFPCCWLAGQVYKWWRPMEDSQEYKVIQSTGGFKKINVHYTPLQSILEGEFFSAIEKSWNIHGVGQGRMKTCGLKCNKGFDPFVAQWT